MWIDKPLRDLKHGDIFKLRHAGDEYVFDDKWCISPPMQSKTIIMDTYSITVFHHTVVLVEVSHLEPTDDMVDAYMAFMQQAAHLHHPQVPYYGTTNGDSEEQWSRRLIKAALDAALKTTSS